MEKMTRRERRACKGKCSEPDAGRTERTMKKAAENCIQVTTCNAGRCVEIMACHQEDTPEKRRA